MEHEHKDLTHYHLNLALLCEKLVYILVTNQDYLTMKKLKITYQTYLFPSPLALFILAGCKQPSFINLTSTNISQNPSGIYTLQTEVDIQDRVLIGIGFKFCCWSVERHTHGPGPVKPHPLELRLQTTTGL